jgi:multiple antibiotic resistance protein
MNDIVNSFLLIYAALFPIVDPVGGAPIFLGLTRQCTDPERHTLARRVAINGFFLLLGSLFAGSYVLEFFGITLPVVRIGGGMVVVAFAWKLLNADELPADQRAAGGTGHAVPPTDAFYPLTMPLTVGPGSIAVAIALGSQRPKGTIDLAHLALLGGAAIAGLIAIAVTIYVCYRFAGRIVAVLGASGTRVLVRLSAFILLCIGIQIVWNGYSALVAITTL